MASPKVLAIHSGFYVRLRSQGNDSEFYPNLLPPNNQPLNKKGACGHGAPMSPAEGKLSIISGCFRFKKYCYLTTRSTRNQVFLNRILSDPCLQML